MQTEAGSSRFLLLLEALDLGKPIRLRCNGDAAELFDDKRSKTHGGRVKADTTEIMESVRCCVDGFEIMSTEAKMR